MPQHRDVVPGVGDAGRVEAGRDAGGGDAGDCGTDGEVGGLMPDGVRREHVMTKSLVDEP
ncbi:hypothetical protein GA0070562_5476 [Micromonospora tulbaghiae]|uniref:Uncharacterized protein n=1 Tax=Micromonospora tulbaghiae TaxID=479978 RepID=A0ABY0KRQ5_9ACTN|nr:hypothetical protein GA0070562_5476 [Micromonospora tulbaghiae]